MTQRRRSGRACAVVALCLGFLTGHAHAATVVWGGSTTTYATASNWVGGSAPASSDTALFAGWAPLDRSGWTVTASVNSGTASNGTDGRRSTLWSTSGNQATNDYFQIDMGSTQTFRQVTLDSTTSSSNYPGNFTVYGSSSSSGPWTSLATTFGGSALVTVTLTSAAVYRHIQIKINSVTNSNPWSVGELFVYGTAGETELARTGWTASSSANAGGAESGAIDGNTGTKWSPGAFQASGQWFSVDMGSAQTFTRIDMDAYSNTGDYPRGYDVYVSSDGVSWGSSIASQTPSTEYTSITFASQTKRYIKVQLNTASGSNWWSVFEFRVYGTPANCNMASNVSLGSMSLDKSITVTQASGVTLTLSGSYSQSAGTFSGGNSTIDITSGFTQSGGTFTSTTGRMRVGGAFSYTGGTFAPSTGQVMLNATTSKTFASGGATFNNLTINDGLAAYWKLDEASGTSAADASGYGNTGTAQNSPTWATSSLPGVQFANSSAVTLNGTNQYIDIPTAVAPTNAAATLCGWAKLAVSNGSFHKIASINGSNVGALTLFRHGGGYFSFETRSTDATSGNTLYQITGTTTPTVGTWYHVCGVYDGTKIHLYVNGTEEGGTGLTVGTIWLASGHTYIGASNFSGVTDYFNGTLDEIRIYSRALSTTEIKSLALGYAPATSSATQTLTGSPVVSGDLVLASGTLAAGANAITVGGSWWNYGGAFSGTGTVTFNGSGSTNRISSGAQIFGGITVSGSGTWTLADALRLPSGTLAINAGTLTGSSYAIQAASITNGGGTFSPSSATAIITGTSSPTIAAATYGALRFEDPSETNLVGYWKFDSAAGTTVRDYSGNSYSGTLTSNPLWSTSVPSAISFHDPAAITFTGANYVDVSSAVTPTNAAFTACTWVNLSSVSGHQTIVGIDGTNISGFFLKRDNGSGKFQMAMYASDSTGAASYFAYNSSSGTTAVAGTWYHVCGVFTGSVIRVYVNGTQEGSDVAVGSTWNATGHTVIGSGKWGGARTDYVSGTVDDVRIYSTALTSTQVAALAAGRYAGTGGATTATLAGATTVNGALNVDSGTLATSTYNLTAANTDATQVATVTAGTLSVGTGTVSAKGGLSVTAGGTLSMPSAGTLAIGSGKTLAVDGTLVASNTSAAIQSVSGTYNFNVGSSSSATPTLNITGLQVKNTTANGMYVNSVAGSSTTFTRFDNIAFSSGTAGGQLLQIYAPSLYLTSSGCTFDASTTYTIKLVGDGFTSGVESTQTRAIFGGATCTAGACQGTESDDDADNDGVPSTTAAPGGSVVQFVRSAGTDTAGTLVGMPTAAFDWNTFTYYSTYAAYNSASGTSPIVYVRDSSGTAKYSWTGSAGETIIGAPRWNTASSTHYLYVAMSSGKIYRLVDNGSSSLVADVAWTTNPFDCSCTITTPLAMDTNNLYWSGTQSGQKMWTLGQSSESQPSGSPRSVAFTVTSASPLVWASSGVTYVFLGSTGNIVKFDATNQVVADNNTNPGSASVWGRIAIGTKTTNRILAGDDAGKFWSIDPASFTGTNKQWSYTVASDTIKSSPYYDYTTDTVMFGTEGGKVVSLTSAGAATTGYPYTPGTSSDVIRSAPLYNAGVLAVGTTTGKLFFLDRNNGTTGPALIREYYFGPTESVSGISFDASTSRYMVTTSDSSANDGKLYYFDLISDPTSGSS